MYCKNHSDREATGACAYCGNLFCEECLVEINGRNYCKEHVITEDKTTMQQLAQIGKETVEDIKSSLPTKEEISKEYAEFKEEMSKECEEFKEEMSKGREEFKKNPVKHTLLYILRISLIIAAVYFIFTKLGEADKINYEETYNVTFANKQQEELFDSFYNEYKYGNAQQGYYNIPYMVKIIGSEKNAYNWEVNSESKTVSLNVSDPENNCKITFLKYGNGNWDMYSLKYNMFEITRDNAPEELNSFLDDIYSEYIETPKIINND